MAWLYLGGMNRPAAPLRISLFKILASSAAVALPLAPSARAEACRFQETTTYSVTYLGAQAGTLTLQALPEDKGACYYEGHVRTDLLFSLFYKVDDTYLSETDPRTLLPERFTTRLNESKQEGTVVQAFRQGEKWVSIATNLKKKKEEIHKDEKKPAALRTQDVISALFYLRAQEMGLGKSVEIPVFIGEEQHFLKVSITGEEELKTKQGQYPAWIAGISLRKEGKNEPVPDTTLWFAKTEGHLLLKVKAKVKIGSVIAYLTKFTPTFKPAAK